MAKIATLGKSDIVRLRGYLYTADMASLKQLRQEYLEYLEIERNRSPKTLENYGRYLTRFVNFVGDGAAEKLTEENIRQYRLHLNRLKSADGDGLKRVSQNYHIIALRNFLKYIAKRDIRSVPAEKIELGKQEDREVTFLDDHELVRLMEAPKGDDLPTLRDRALLHTLFSTGMRVSEVCSLDRAKIDLGRGEVPIRGKGGKLRVVFLSNDARNHIAEYITARPDVDEALFIRIPKSGTFGKDSDLRLTTRSVQRIVKKYATLAGIMGKDVTPHKLRHSYATDLLRNGADIRSVQAMLGHSSVTTTQIYTHVTDKGLKEIHEKFHNKK
jgi:site-specific recombinase XerD